MLVRFKRHHNLLKRSWETFKVLSVNMTTQWIELGLNHHSRKLSHQSHGYIIVLLIIVINSILVSSLIGGNIAVTEVLRVMKVRFALEKQKLSFLQPWPIPNSS